MPNIEERVVGMRFDSSKFQSGIKPAVDGLDKLKNSLKLEGATKAIGELDNAGKRFSLAGVATAAEGVSGKFIALATIGITALTNITNKAINAGQQIVSALTIDPIKAGLDEYELKMGSIQTILANTARYNTGLPEVTASLEELNKYADKTIYNFGDMTKNIGLFTNAGMKIEDATANIKGFSNVAAASGTTSQGAAGAAYQLSQAMSAGTIRLMDWRSLTNVGMGNKNMQNGIIEIADAMGTLDKNSTNATEIQGNFNASLEKNWLSADVMSTYLKIMAEDTYDSAKAMALAAGLSEKQADVMAKQAVTANDAATKVRTLTQLYGTMKEAAGSGWAQSFDIIIGDFNEATELWTGVNNTLGSMIGAASDARNKILQDWSDNGGREAAIEAIATAFKTLMSILKPVREAFEEIFPPVTGKNLATITKNIRDFIAGLKPGKEMLDNIKSTAKGFFAALDIGRMILVGFIKMFVDILGTIAPAGAGLLGFTGDIGDFIVKIRDAIKNGEGLGQFFTGFGTVLKVIIGIVASVVGVVADLGASLGGLSKSGADGFIDRIQDRFAAFGSFFAGVGRIVEAFGRGVQAVANFFEPFISRISELTQGLGAALASAFESGQYDAVFDMLNTGLLAGIGALIFKFVKTVKKTLEGINPGGGIKDAIKGVFGQLGSTLEALQGQIKAKTLMLIAAAVGILTLSVIGLSLIDSGKLFVALGAISIMFVQLGAAMAVFDKIFTVASAAKLAILSAGMIGLATAMLIFSGAIAIMGSMSWEGLIKGLVGLAGALAIMSGAMLLMSKVGPGAILGSVALVIASAGIVLLAGALKLMALLSWDDIGRAMTVLGASLAILAVGLTLMAGSLPGAAALTIASVGLAVLGAALLLFAMLSWDDIGRGMTVLGASLAIMAVGLTLMVAAMPGAAALVVASVGLAVIAGVLQLFALLSWEAIGKAMTLLGGTLGILAVGLTLMIVALPGAAALVVAAGALAILAPVLLLLGTMSWETIGTGLAALALTLGIIALAGYALIPALPGLIGLGAAVALLGIGVLAAGIGIAALSVGLTGLAVAGGAAITVLVAAVSSIATLIPFVLKQVGLGLIEIIKIIGSNGPAILGALTTILLALIQAIVKVIPPAVAAIVKLVISLVNALVKLIPKLVDAGMKLVIGILDGIAKNIGKVITKGTDIIVAFLAGVGKAIPRLLRAAADLVIDFLNGIASTIRSRSAQIRAAGKNIASAIIEGVTGGITDGISTVVNAARDMAEGALNAAKNFLGIASPSKEFTEVGKFSTQGFANGFIKNAGIAVRAATQMGKSTLSAIKRSMANAGDLMAQGGMDTSPTIRPVLDLSGIKRDAGLIGGIVGNQTLAVDGATARANEISAKYGEYQQAVVESQGPTTEVNLVQNNYSPKALPAAEIYRQSNNQMSILKGELEKNA